MCHAGVRSHWYIWRREVWGQDAGEHSGKQVAGRASRGGPGSGYSGLLINQRPTNAGRHALTDLQPGRPSLLFSRPGSLSHQGQQGFCATDPPLLLFNFSQG